MANFETDLLIEVESGGNFGGTDDYRELKNKPVINGVVLEGVKSSEDLGLLGADALNGYDTSAQVDEKIKDFVTDAQVQDMIDESLSDYTPGSPAPAPAQSYDELANKPYLNDVEISGARTAHDYGLATEQQIEAVSDMVDGIIIPDRLPTPQQLTLKNNLTGNIVRFDGSASVGFEFPELYLSGEAAGSPVGEIIAFMGTVTPDNYLPCDGSLYDIADYPYLAQFFIDNFNSVNHFGGDGITIFAVPDLRGEFLRGTGTNSHTEQGNGHDVGGHQDGTSFCPIEADTMGNPWVSSQSSHPYNADVIKREAGFKSLEVSRTASDSTSVKYLIPRPTNTSVLYCIKYRPTFYLNSGHTYSLEERRVGTWIDGKPLYEKTVYFGNLPDSSNKEVEFLSEAPEFAWIEKGMVFDGESSQNYFFGESYPNMKVGSDNSYIFGIYGNKVKGWTKSNRAVEIAHIVVRYTKTTDTAGAIPGGYDNDLTFQSTPKKIGDTVSYNDVQDKPKINSVELVNDKSLNDLGVDSMTNRDILDIISKAAQTR